MMQNGLRKRVAEGKGESYDTARLTLVENDFVAKDLDVDPGALNLDNPGEDFAHGLGPGLNVEGADTEDDGRLLRDRPGRVGETTVEGRGRGLAEG